MILRIIISALFLSISFSSLAQKKAHKKHYGFYGRVFLENIKGEDVTVKLYDDNKLISDYKTDKKGKFSVVAGIPKHYTLEFSKRGFVTKRVIINTRKVNASKGNIDDFDFNVYLIEEIESVNYSILDFPIALIEYRKNIKGFDYNKKYTRQMHKIQNEVVANENEFVFHN